MALAHDLPPLGESGGASFALEVSADEVALRDEMVVDGVGAHAIDSLLADLVSEYRPEPVPPKPDRLLSDVDASHEQ